MPSNAAAWIVGPKVSPFEVRDAPYPSPGSKDVVVQNAVVAINPMEYKIQDYNPAIGGTPFNYPTILGADLAGTIVSTGSEVTTFKVGDRIIADSSGILKDHPAGFAFQQFVVLPESRLTPLPNKISFESGAVLPLACTTAFAGLFVPTQLGLSTALLESSKSERPASNSVLLLWGGSSSVGLCATQIAHAAGYEVYATASKRNHSLCVSMGATEVFDHSDPKVEDAIIAALKGKTVVGALDCIADKDKTMPACARILSQSSGSKRLITVLGPPEHLAVEGVEALRLSIPSMLGTKTYDIVHAWMARALADGTLQPKPDPLVIGTGLESVQLGIDTSRKGVSATKVVVKL